MSNSPVSTYLHRYQQQMPEQDDLTLIILKGHLLVEEKLNEIIAVHFADEAIIDRLNLRFQQKATLVEGIVAQRLGRGNWWDKWLWTTIITVNSIRNDLAHNLEPPKLQDKSKKLIKIYDDLRLLMTTSYRQQTGRELPVPPKLPYYAAIRTLIAHVLSDLEALHYGLASAEIALNKAFASSGVAAFKEGINTVSNEHIREQFEKLDATTSEQSASLRKILDEEQRRGQDDLG